MVPGTDEIAQKVYDRISDLKDETTDFVACAVAVAMMRGAYRALRDHYADGMANMSLSDLLEKHLAKESNGIS